MVRSPKNGNRTKLALQFSVSAVLEVLPAISSAAQRPGVVAQEEAMPIEPLKELES
jgi:hypothetical protein